LLNISMSNQTQRAVDPDFLEGIDEQFQRLMKLSSNGKRNGRSNGRPAEDPLMIEIVNQSVDLSKNHKELVLSYIRALKQKAE
jgi:hypothetical protein